MEQRRVLSTQAAAHFVKDALNRLSQTQFTARPFNFHSPEESLWWLVPSKEWPAYRHAKLVLYKDSGVFCIGLHFEKGFDRQTVEYIEKKKYKYVLRSDWVLLRMFNDISTGLFGERMLEIQQAIGQGLQLRVYATVFSALDADARTQPQTQDCIRFRIDQSGLIPQENPEAGVLGNHQNMRDFKELTMLLEDDVLGYNWLDFQVVFEVPYANQSRLAACAEAFLEHYPEAFQ